MQSIIGEHVFRLLKFINAFMWSLLLGALEWIIPRNWYAKSVDQDIVLVTGAGSGLGRDLCLEYARLGSSLVLWDINEEGMKRTKELVELEYYARKSDERTKNDTDKRCLMYRVDVSDREQVKKIAEQVKKDLNEGTASLYESEKYVSVLVNNAGIYYGLNFNELREDQIERIFKINVLAHFWTVRAFLPDMIKHEKGHIVEVASMGGIAGMVKQVDYCATKFATVGFEESLAMELDQLGLSDKIHTTVVCPFFFSSNLFTDYDDSKSAPLMSSEFVAREAVLTMRCNHARILLPSITAYSLYLLKPILPKKSRMLLAEYLGYIDGVKKIKGRAASSALSPDF